MSNIKVLSYKEITRILDKEKYCHLLLGNGFSRARFEDVFSYDSLLDSADFSKLSKEARKSFDDLSTTNFETVIKTLRNSSILHKLYLKDGCPASETMSTDSIALKGVLVDTIAKQHPANPSSISDESYVYCRKFLEPFKTIYTVNYDLLLYWTIMGDMDKPASKHKYDDGFRHPQSENEADYVTWEIENTNKQNINYLHGALHLFASENELKKFSWIRTGLPLMQQIISALDTDMYPLIVSEGTSKQKMAQVMRSGYLLRALKSLAAITGTLVIFGHSINENDAHIFKRIEIGNVSRLCVGLYGDPNSIDNKGIQLRVDKIVQKRSKKRPLEVLYFDSSSAAIWEKEGKV